MFQISFNLFCSGEKSRRKIKMLKTEAQFCRWKSNDCNHISIFLSLENHCTACTFLFVKGKTWKHIFNTKSELSQNHTEKQFMPSKATLNWLFNDIWCYFVIGCFDWKIGVFQRTVVKVYYILKEIKILKGAFKESHSR